MDAIIIRAVGGITVRVMDTLKFRGTGLQVPTEGMDVYAQNLVHKWLWV